MSRDWLSELLGADRDGPVFLLPGEDASGDDTSGEYAAVTAEALRSWSPRPAGHFALLTLDRTAAGLTRYLGTLTSADTVLVPVGHDAPRQRTAMLSGLLGHVGHTPDLGLILTTSGSTGKPKAVGLPLDALVAFAATAPAAYGLGPADRILVAAMVDGDYYLEELLLTLGSGGTGVVLPPDRDVTDPGFAGWLGRHEITVVDLPLTRWRQLAAALDETGTVLPRCVRTLMVGGEPLRPDDVAAVRRLAADGATLINLYGPTETTIVATCHNVPLADGNRDADGSGAPAADASLPIGTPLPGAECYVVDGSLRPVAPGEPGELLIGGPGLARGYVGDAAGTAARFIPDALSGQPGRRLYRTGDRVVESADGGYRFLGRIDDQVKIRGFRVEPGEVEAALLGLDTVDMAAVRAVDDGDGAYRLVAYVREATAPTAELRNGLAKTLPAHMMPARWVRLAQFPLTPTGKIDKGRLPDGEPAADRANGTGTASDAPGATLTERLVGQVWSHVLGIPEVGPDDSFFHLGGQSRESIKVAAILRDRLSIDLGLADVLRRPVLRDLASFIDESRAGTKAPVSNQRTP